MVEHKSFVLSASFPGSRKGVDEFRRAVETLASRHISTLEYYNESLSPAKAASILNGKRSIFLAGARQKAENLNPCSSDRETRARAVERLTACFHFARQAGAAAVMLSSGPRPADEAQDPECLSWLADSLEKLHQAEPDLPILLEPGDRDVEYLHLLGPTALSADFAAARRRDGLPLELLFDISHTAQLGEDLVTAWERAKPFCRHVHLANCVLDKSSPLYGDKHPFFGVPLGVYSHQDARNFFTLLENERQKLTTGIEMICPAGEKEDDFFRRLEMDAFWFFEKPIPSAG